MGNGAISLQTIIEKSNLTQDVQAELERLKKQNKDVLKQDTLNKGVE